MARPMKVWSNVFAFIGSAATAKFQRSSLIYKETHMSESDIQGKRKIEHGNQSGLRKKACAPIITRHPCRKASQKEQHCTPTVPDHVSAHFQFCPPIDARSHSLQRARVIRRQPRRKRPK